MAKPSRHMILTTFLVASGYYQDAWRLEGSRSEELGELDFLTDLTRMAEDAKLDSIFFGDVVNSSTVLDNKLNTTAFQEPLTMLAALAARTTRIGLSGTVSTTFSLPYVTARQLSSVDMISGGRVGWNMVTSWMGAENFGLEQMPSPEERYRQASEFVDVAIKLWDGWSDEAVVNDRESGVWVDPAKVRHAEHVGEFYRVQGALPMKRSPQGRPVLFQAGQSPDGMRFGAKYADAIYMTQRDRRDSARFVESFRKLVVAEGREASSVKLLPGVVPIIGETRKDAEEYALELANHINFEKAKGEVGRFLGIDLMGFDVNDRIPASLWIRGPGHTSRWDLYRELGVEQGFTIRQLAVEYYRSGAHLSLTGTASEIADVMALWFENGAADGFNLNAPSMPEGLRRICTQLVPELQTRGYFREEYEGTTLREHLGLERPGAWDAR